MIKVMVIFMLTKVDGADIDAQEIKDALTNEIDGMADLFVEVNEEEGQYSIGYENAEVIEE